MSIVINDVSPRVHYTAAAGQTVFPVPFEFLDIADVFVYVGEVLQTYSATPQFNTQYNLIGAGTNDVKQVVFGGGGRLAGELVVIYRDMPIQSPADFPTTGVFPVTELNEAMDSLTAMIQQTEVNILLRSLTLNWADEPRALNPLPNKAARVNKVLGFDSTGQPIAVEPGLDIGGEGSNADTLNSQPGSYYLNRANHTGQDEISEIIGLQQALDLKANINSPILTGEPKSVTPPNGDNSTSIATTAFVSASAASKLDDAPADAATYGRRNGAWVEAVREAPVDLNIYGRSGKQWVPVTGGSGGGGGGSGSATIKIDVLPPEAPLHGDMWWDSDAGGLYIYYNDGNTSQWVQAAAPALFDTQQFAKKTDLTTFPVESSGTWTPTMTFGGASVGVTYASRSGRWHRIGGMITCWFTVALTAKGSSVGVATIEGLPVPPAATNVNFTGALHFIAGITAGNAVMACYGGTGSNKINLQHFANPSTTTGLAPAYDTIFTNTSHLQGQVTYEVA